MIGAEIVEQIRLKYEALTPYLNEQTRRVWAAIEARSLGHGGVSAVSQATGLSRNTITAGQRTLVEAAEDPVVAGRIRKPGGGRKRVEEQDAELIEALDRLVEPATRGDPQSPLRWTCKSVSKLAQALKQQGHCVSAKTVYTLLRSMDYSLQSNRKTREGKDHPDRDAQFEHIATTVAQFQQKRRPAISIDTKKKELVGNFHNPGQEWQPQGEPVEVNAHDFPDKTLGKAIPYGVYDLSENQGWVSVGIDHDTAEFAVESIRHWWLEMGQPLYPKSKHLLITADCGGSNGYRNRLWKLKLQEFADEMGLTVHLCHFPPGTSKWNKIEHRLFCHITQNWRARPLTSWQVIVNLIGSTTTEQGLEVRAHLDQNQYKTGIKVTDEQFNTIAIRRQRFHGDWNYQISPRKTA
jgi:transposase